MIRRTLGRSATLVLTAGSALALAIAPAFAAVSGTTDNVDTVLISSIGGADNIGVSCLAGQAAVNGSVALPALACGVVKEISASDDSDSDTVNLANAKTEFAALTLTSINVDDGVSDAVTGSAVRDEVYADSDDTVSSGAGGDRVNGGGTVDGGDGDDLLFESFGSVQGGPGNDRIVKPSSGPLDGGAGEDSVELDFIETITTLGLTFVLADTGLTISAPSITPVTLVGTNLEQWVLTMTEGASPDVLDSRTYAGRVVYRALDGNDTVLGGAGPDYVDGGSGNDSLNPGGGSDAVHGGEGNDAISVQDGVADVVDCGAGTDSVIADRSDALSNCETVSLPAPETGKIDGPKKIVKGEKATYAFGSSTAGATFECQLDKGAFKACSSPFKVKSKKLKTGKHTLTVRAVQPAGNVDPTPSAFKFKVIANK